MKIEDLIWLLMMSITVFIIVIPIFIFWGFSIIPYNQYAVEYEFGNLKPTVVSEGIKWVGFGNFKRVNNQIRNYEITVESASNDFQNVKIILNLNLKINKDEVYNFVKNYKNENLFTQYLNNKVQEKVKTIILKYSAEEMLLNRTVLSKKLFKAVIEIPELQYFIINDLTIKNIEFSKEFNDMLERRASVEQEKIIIEKQKENLELLKKNIETVNINTYFKYKLIEKWDGKADLLISDAILKK